MLDARFSWSASVHSGCVHRRGELDSTSGVDGRAVAFLVMLLVKQCDSRTVGADLCPVGEGMQARAGVGGSVRVDFVCW